MDKPLTLAVLKRAAPLLSITPIARAAEVSPQTLHTKLRRGTPDLTAEEAERIAGALKEVGIILR